MSERRSEETPPIVVSRREAARLTGLSERTLARRVASGEQLGFARNGGRAMFHRQTLIKWIEKNFATAK